MSEVTKPYHRISTKAIARELNKFPIATVAGHLDLEGLCYLKIVRTGADKCIIMDDTQRVLEKEMSWKEIERTFWREPACEKAWGKDRL